jgi:hypothetical protein
MFVWDVIAQHDYISDISTVIASFGTLVAAAIAASSLRQSKNNSRTNYAEQRKAHMHTIFRDFIKSRNEHEKFLLVTPNLTPTKQAALIREHESLKLYTLEEMLDWANTEVGIRNADRSLHFRAEFPFISRQVPDNSYVDGWLSTIKWHLNRNPSDLAQAYLEAPDCYGPAFKKFVAQNLNVRVLDPATTAKILGEAGLVANRTPTPSEPVVATDQVGAATPPIPQ